MARPADLILQANTSFNATVDGVAIAIHEGETIDADHPIVRRYPQYFDSVAVIHRTSRSEPIVEQATAAPGEKRGDPFARHRQLVQDAKALDLPAKGTDVELQAAIDAKFAEGGE